MTTSSIGVLKIYRRDPDNVVTWEEAKAKILSKSALLEVCRREPFKERTVGFKSTRQGEQLLLRDLKGFLCLDKVYRGRFRRLLITRYPFGIFCS